MEHPPGYFDTNSEPISVHVATGLSKVSTALKAHAWQGAAVAGLTPTQGQALLLLRDVPGGLRLAALASALAVSAPTASDALGSLVLKGLVQRGTEPENRRAASFTLTAAGAAMAVQVAAWPGFLSRAAQSIGDAEQEILYRALIKLIRAMQVAGDIPVQRLCVTCRYFRPNVHDAPAAPHHCAFVDAAFGDRHLRMDCLEQVPAPDAELADLWTRFNHPAAERHTR